MHSKYLRRAGLAAGLAMLGLAGVPAVAGADSVSVQGTTLKLTLSSSNGENPRAFVEQSGDTFTVTDYNTGMTGCEPGEFNDIQVRRCTAPGITRVVVTGTSLAEYVELYASLDDDIVSDVNLGGGDDQVEDHSGGRSIVDAGAGEDDVETYDGDDEIHGGPGRDDLGGGAGDDEIFGDADNDTIFGVAGADTIHGGAGDDHLFGGDDADHVLGDADQDDLRGNAGPDTLDGGAGDDELEGSDAFDDVSPDVLVGGTGVDTVNYADREGSGSTTEVSLDGRANDGLGGPAEGDDVGPDGSVENVMIDDFGTRAVLTGDDGPNELDAGFTDGGAAVEGRGGDDVITGSSDPATGDVLHGGGDDDTIAGGSGGDEVYGDAGDDDVDGNSGDDYVEGGPGTDHIHGGNGDDAVEAQDEEVDGVSCGDGADVASVDSTDVLDASPFEVCESRIVHVIDTTPPQTTLTLGPAEGAAIRATSVGFGFTADENGARFECKLDAGAFTACADARSLTAGSASYSGLAQGAHTFSVRSIDGSDNVDATPVVRHFTVDTVAPDTTLSGGPAAGSTQTTRTATFTFSSPDGSATLLCRLDGAAYAACPGGSRTFTGLADGAHTFSVKARDGAGNEDASPATRTWTVDVPDPTPPTDPTPPADPTPPTAPTPPADPTPAGPSTAALKSGVSKAATAAMKAVKKAGLKALAKKGSYSRSVKMPGAGAYGESVTVKPRKGKAVKFAAGRKRFAAATSAKVKVKLTAKGKRLAKKSRKLKLTVTTTFKATGQKTVKKTRTVNVKR